MKAEEHQLLIMMFARQSQLIQMLINLLKSKEIIQADDLQAFDFSVRADTDTSAALLLGMANQYYAFGRELGLDLPGAKPPSPDEMKSI